MKEIGEKLLKKYFEEQCTPQEKEQVEEWLTLDESNVSINDDYLNNFDNKAIKEEIWREIKPTKEIFKKHQNLTNLFLKVAASLVFLISSALAFQYGEPLFKSNEIAYRTITSDYGEKSHVTLLDGTHITLNAGSKLKIPIDFLKGKERIVQLQGEAYLEVAKNPNRPFSVITPKMTVRVLGTKFNVKSYKSDSLSSVTVKEGSVSVTDSLNHQVILVKGQMAIYTKAQQNLVKIETNIDKHISWTEETLVFKDQSLSEIATVLERWYNIKISIANKSLKNDHFTGTFKNAPILTKVIHNMALTMQFKYKFKKDTLMIY